jgi:hypothetical protein
MAVFWMLQDLKPPQKFKRMPFWNFWSYWIQKEPRKTFENTSGRVRPERVNKWTIPWLLHDDDDYNDWIQRHDIPTEFRTKFKYR